MRGWPDVEDQVEVARHVEAGCEHGVPHALRIEEGGKVEAGDEGAVASTAHEAVGERVEVDVAVYGGRKCCGRLGSAGGRVRVGETGPGCCGTASRFRRTESRSVRRAR